MDSEYGGGTSGREAERVARRTRAENSYKGGRIVLDYTLANPQVQEISRKIEENEQALSFLNGDTNVPNYIKIMVSKEVAKIYNSNAGEREGRLAETDFTKAPYQSYNDDAIKNGIDQKDFEKETSHLRGQKPQTQNST